MRIAGTVTIAAAPAQVWQYLVDPQRVTQCVPGLASWNMSPSAQKLHLRLAWPPGNPKGLYLPATLVWAARRPPHHMRLAADVAMHGGETITLAATMDLGQTAVGTTELNFTATIMPPRKVMEQMLRNIIPKAADAFFKCLKENLESV